MKLCQNGGLLLLPGFFFLRLLLTAHSLHIRSQGYRLAGHGICLDFCGTFLRPVVDDAVDHAVIILHRHFSGFQIIVCLELFQFLKAEGIAVMIRYIRPAFDRNDVADGQAVPGKIRRAINIELCIRLLQYFTLGAAVIKRLCVNCLVVVGIGGIV